MSADKHQRIPALDALRAAAILWVMLHHLLGRFVPYDANGVWVKFLEAGNAGVDLFFVLSGYLIGRIVLAEMGRTATLDIRQFWYRRWMRTFPAYYATLAAILLTDFIFPPDRPWPALLAYPVFLQTYAASFTSLRFPWSWSLCVEEWFYLTLPLVLLALNRIAVGRPERVLRLVAAAAVATSVVSRALIYYSNSGQDAYWFVYATPHCRLDGIAAGLFVATLSRPKQCGWTTSLLGVAVVFLALFIWADRPRIVVFQQFAVFAALFGVVVYASLSGGRWTNARLPGAALIADLSYALYLVHPIFTKAVQRLAPVNVYLQVALFFAVSFAAALVFRYGVEKPFLALRDRTPRPLVLRKPVADAAVEA